MLYSVELANQRCYKAPLSLICDCKVITLFWNRQIFLPYFSKIIFQIQTKSRLNPDHEWREQFESTLR